MESVREQKHLRTCGHTLRYGGFGIVLPGLYVFPAFVAKLLRHR